MFILHQTDWLLGHDHRLRQAGVPLPQIHARRQVRAGCFAQYAYMKFHLFFLDKKVQNSHPCARSEVFAAMLRHEFLEKQNSRYVISMRRNMMPSQCQGGREGDRRGDDRAAAELHLHGPGHRLQARLRGGALQGNHDSSVTLLQSRRKISL